MRWLIRIGALMMMLGALLVYAAVSSAAPCVGDCDTDGAVAISELVTGVRVLLGDVDLHACPAMECTAGTGPQINCAVIAVRNALEGCPRRYDACGTGCARDCFPFLNEQCPCPQTCSEFFTVDGMQCAVSFCADADAITDCVRAFAAAHPELCHAVR